MRHIYRFSLFLLIASLFFQEATAQTNITADKDNTIYEPGSLSNGVGENFFAGRSNFGAGSDKKRGLLHFDIAGSIPSGSVISTVVLTLYMNRTFFGTAQTIDMHKLDIDWGESTSDAPGGEGGGAASAANDASWLCAFDNGAGGCNTSWTTAGGDFSATVSASTSVAGIASYTWPSTAQLVADVQNMLDDPSNNFGWILIGNEASTVTAKRFSSREGTTPPILTVTIEPVIYTVGGSVSGLAGSGLVLQNNAGDDLPITADGSFTFTTPLVDGEPYAVTVLTQPAGLSQTCDVTNGNGTLVGADVTNVSVTCVSKPEEMFADGFEDDL